MELGSEREGDPRDHAEIQCQHLEGNHPETSYAVNLYFAQKPVDLRHAYYQPSHEGIHR